MQRMEILIALVGVAFFLWIRVIGERRSAKHLHDFFRTGPTSKED
jgi:hypothetical protein